jgi:hypothetical protein
MPSFCDRTCPGPQDLELSSLDRYAIQNLVPCCHATHQHHPVAGIIISRVWANKMHTNSSTDPREIRQISDKRTLLLGQNPTCADGPISLPLHACEMRSCTRKA